MTEGLQLRTVSIAKGSVFCPPALPPTTATWPGSGKCPEISAAG
jgi:hypothetical protein